MFILKTEGTEYNNEDWKGTMRTEKAPAHMETHTYFIFFFFLKQHQQINFQTDALTIINILMNMQKAKCVKFIAYAVKIERIYCLCNATQDVS